MLLHALGKAAQRRALVQTEDLAQRVKAGRVEARVHRAVKGRKLADRPAAEHAQIVRDIADAAFDLRVFIDRQTADRDRPGIRPVDAGQVPDGRGFARAIRADQAVDRPLRHAERQLVQRFFAAEGLCDMGKLDHGVGSSSVSSCASCACVSPSWRSFCAAARKASTACFFCCSASWSTCATNEPLPATDRI